MSRDPDSALWAVCCLFNPCGYKRRLTNYHLFRANLPVPLLTVELSFDGAFPLRADDADLLVQISGGAVLWQKERLLNRGLAHLPAACTAVAVLDADLIFEELDWPQAALTALDTVPVVQLFFEVLHMPDRWKLREYSLAACLGAQYGDGRGAYCGDFAHAYRRTLLDALGLFDANIGGDGDTAMAAASFGVCEIAEASHDARARIATGRSPGAPTSAARAHRGLGRARIAHYALRGRSFFEMSVGRQTLTALPHPPASAARSTGCCARSWTAAPMIGFSPLAKKPSGYGGKKTLAFSPLFLLNEVASTL